MRVAWEEGLIIIIINVVIIIITSIVIIIKNEAGSVTQDLKELILSASASASASLLFYLSM